MNIVLVWAGWSWLSAIIELFYSLHIPNIVCIDATDTANMQRFRKLWITTYIWHGIYEVKPDDLVIYSAATPNSIEVQTAMKNMYVNHLCPAPMLYFEFLGELSKYLYTIAISGTHGKSTTTSMVWTACIEHFSATSLVILWAWVTQRKGKNCWYNEKHTEELHNIVTRILSRKATSLKIPQKKLIFVVEADEFNHHFLFLEPDISIITSLDHDHVDVYPTRESYIEAFKQFCKNTKDYIVTLPRIVSQIWDYWKKMHIPEVESFAFTYLVGWHNHNNATLALQACVLANSLFNQEDKSEEIKNSIEQFQWLQRRVELLWTNAHWIPIFSDYGHHPDEIKSTLAAFTEKYPHSQITCFFEAHQARRLLTFRDEFVSAFQGVACIVVPPYTAREDITTIQAYTRELPSDGSLPKEIRSFNDIATAFTTQVAGKNMTDRSLLQYTLDEINVWSILCFSAWVLDSKLRASIK